MTLRASVSLLAGLLLAATGSCSRNAPEPEPPPRRIGVRPEHRRCTQHADCTAIDVDCEHAGCSCGEAINVRYLRQYGEAVSACRKDRSIAWCDYACSTPFPWCVDGACVLSAEPHDVVENGVSLRKLCEASGGQYSGCPGCPPGVRCGSCLPCACPSYARWAGGCQVVVHATPDALALHPLTPRAAPGESVRFEFENGARETVWLSAPCDAVLHRMRRSEDSGNVGYDRLYAQSCPSSYRPVPPGARIVLESGKLVEYCGPGPGAGGPVAPRGCREGYHPAPAGTYRFEVPYTDQAPGEGGAPVPFRTLHSGAFRLAGP